MRYALRHGPSGLDHWHRGHRGLRLFDFDGTLAPIADHPRSAKALPIALKRLEVLSQQHPGQVGVLSGRPLRQVRELIGIRGLIYGGTHGFEIEGPGVHFRQPLSRRERAAFRRFTRRLQRAVERLPGLWLEKKRWTLTVHYRGARSTDHARVASLLQEIRSFARKQGFTTQQGLKAIELYPPGGWNKGKAVRWIMKRLGARHVLYVGDDTTDETVFRALGPAHATIRVGRNRHSKAAYYLKHQREISHLIERLILP